MASISSNADVDGTSNLYGSVTWCSARSSAQHEPSSYSANGQGFQGKAECDHSSEGRLQGVSCALIRGLTLIRDVFRGRSSREQQTSGCLSFGAS